MKINESIHEELNLPEIAWEKLIAEVPAVATILPRIVMESEVCALLDAGMGVQPEFREGAGVGVLKPCAAERVESVDRSLPRIGNYSHNGFLPVDVGLVLKVSADGVCAGFDEETGDGQHEEERDEAGAAAEGFDAPAMPDAANQPAGDAGADPKNKKDACGRNGEALEDVVQNVMAGFMGEDEKD